MVHKPTPTLTQAAREGHSLCWFCKTDVGAEPLCPQCVKIQPLGRNSDYFTVMGLPRKLDLDPRVLEPVFHALSRRFHPDMYRMASPRERIIALENSAVLNQAYRTLRDPFERAAYLLDLELGREAARGKDSPPQELFEEILEVQELLGDFKFADAGEKAALRSRLAGKLDALQAEQQSRADRLTGELFRRWDALDTPDAEQKRRLLDEIRRIIGERAYLRRVLDGLTEALEQRAVARGPRGR
jgi:molecular chaperone HscB